MYTKRGDCQPLIKLDKPFCEHYGFKLDKYVNVSVDYQRFWNKRLWELQKQYDQVFVEARNVSASPECIEQIRFAGCHFTFPGCDRSTSGFRSKTFCKESCLHFTYECNAFVKAWKYILLPNYPDIDAWFSCVRRPPRNAGDSPECVYYDRKESLEKEGMLVDRLVVRIFSTLSDTRSVQRLVCLSSLSQAVIQSIGQLVSRSVISIEILDIKCLLLFFLSKKFVATKWRISKGILTRPKLLCQGILRGLAGECELLFPKIFQLFYTINGV